MKKLVLVQPNQKWQKNDPATGWRIPPTVLCRLAACVRDIVEVSIIDAQLYDLSEDAFKTAIMDARPDYVGISLLTSEYATILDRAAALAKAADPGIVVIGGGVHVTVNGEDVMANSNIDYGCRGEGEVLLRELLLFLEGKGERPSEGLLFRENGRTVVQERTLVRDLDALPPPAYDLVRMEDYLEGQDRYGPNRLPDPPGIALSFSRGCPYECSFCQVETISGKQIRVPAPEAVVDELERLKTTYGIRSFIFSDDNLFAAKKRVKAILRAMIARDLGLKWMVNGFSIFTMDEELVDLMAEAGCVGVNAAIESGNRRVLRDIVKKPIKDLDRVPELIRSIKDRGVFVLANFIIGLPGETWEEIRDTIRFAEHCGADYVKFFIATPLKGTALYDMAEQMGALDHDHGEVLVSWRVSQVKSDDWTPWDVSILRAYEWDRINFSPDRIDKVLEIWGASIEEINAIRAESRRSLFEELRSARS